MIRLTTREASVLARIAQYENLPEQERTRMVDDLDGQAKEVGLALLGRENPSSDAVREMAAAIQEWVRSNRQFSEVARTRRAQPVLVAS